MSMLTDCAARQPALPRSRSTTTVRKIVNFRCRSHPNVTSLLPQICSRQVRPNVQPIALSANDEFPAMAEIRCLRVSRPSRFLLPIPTTGTFIGKLGAGSCGLLADRTAIFGKQRGDYHREKLLA
jgi:hypothetical protein